MAQASVVYGCITDMLFVGGRKGLDDGELQARRQQNYQATQALPSVEDWPLLCREMFSQPLSAVDFGDGQTDVIHFGSSYKAIEHEWDNWIRQFEDLLHDMYWVSATVHLQTALNGSHTFVWHCDEDFHAPGQGGGRLRCEWLREDALS